MEARGAQGGIKKMEVTWNRTNFKRLGRVRVQVWETIFAIVVPVGLLSYVFGRRCPLRLIPLWQVPDVTSRGSF
jgi:hypothetical protein